MLSPAVLSDIAAAADGAAAAYGRRVGMTHLRSLFGDGRSALSLSHQQAALQPRADERDAALAVPHLRCAPAKLLSSRLTPVARPCICEIYR